ncbi:hypothetical protein [Sandarakinorhabdus sp. AAP62]|uniref:hypothetical protein n=1 Tax=Sandarakinorhabdus sp. AAP62 TaxID=1248916 RepID=UPI0002F7109A|nr:hypothetical protein [Sandarakinorhabdus sp. AAP62]
MLRTEPLAYLPALLALALAAMSVTARAEAPLISLCSGKNLPREPSRECDQACHIGCSREKRGSGRL